MRGILASGTLRAMLARLLRGLGFLAYGLLILLIFGLAAYTSFSLFVRSGNKNKLTEAHQRKILDAFTARKAKTRTTGNASRGYNALPSIGTTNLYLEPGTKSPRELIGEVDSGLYVTAMLGRGANVVTGEYSTGKNVPCASTTRRASPGLPVSAA